MREPTESDLEMIKQQLDDYNYYNKKYILMKAKMIRQGILKPKYVKEDTNVIIQK